MAITLRQATFAQGGNIGVQAIATWPLGAPLKDSLLAAYTVVRTNVSQPSIAGWTQHFFGRTWYDDEVSLFWRIAPAGLGPTVTPIGCGNYHRIGIAELVTSRPVRLVGAAEMEWSGGVAVTCPTSPPNGYSSQGAAPRAGTEAVLIGAANCNIGDGANGPDVTPGASVIELDDGKSGSDFHPLGWFAYRPIPAASGAAVDITGTSALAQTGAGLGLAFQLDDLVGMPKGYW